MRKITPLNNGWVFLKADLSPEQADVPFRFLRAERDKLTYRIKLHAFKGLCRCFLITDIHGNLMNVPRHFRFPGTAVQQPYIPLRIFRQFPDNSHTDGSGASDEQCFHFWFLLRCIILSLSAVYPYCLIPSSAPSWIAGSSAFSGRTVSNTYQNSRKKIDRAPRL